LKKEKLVGGGKKVTIVISPLKSVRQNFGRRGPLKKTGVRNLMPIALVKRRVR
jgi:hypothetical protein